MKKAATNGAAAAKKAVTANGTAAAANGKAAANGTTDKDGKLKSPNLVKDMKKRGDDKENITGVYNIFINQDEICSHKLF